MISHLPSVRRLFTPRLHRAFGVLLLSASTNAFAQDPANLPVPPNGYDQPRGGAPRGNVELVNYPTRNNGQEVMRVYTPPGYSEQQVYPTLYLMHGIGGDENEWYNGGAPHVILDNLLAEGKAVPMVLVLPNGKSPKSAGNQGFENFGDVLLNDLIPFMEQNYAVSSKQIDRALAGLSMGGGQTVNFGFPNTDVFAWLGAFSPAPNSRSAQQTITDVAAVKANLRFIFLSNGETEVQPYHPITQGYRDFLTAQNVPYMYQREPGAGHDFTAWKRSLYNFAQRIFTHEPDATSGETSDTGSTGDTVTVSEGLSGSDAGATGAPETSSSQTETVSSSAGETSTSATETTTAPTTVPVTPTTAPPVTTAPVAPSTTAPPVGSTTAPMTGTTAPGDGGTSESADGCSCKVGRAPNNGARAGWALALLAAATLTRRTRRLSTRAQ